MRLALGALATVAAIAALAPTSALGHAAFVESEPEAGARLKSGPAEITLAFTEPLDQKLTEVRLADAESGAPIPAAHRFEEEREIVLSPQRRLERAPYRIEWHTVSTVDGHALEGSFSFGVRTAAVATDQSLEQSPLARDGWLRIGARALFYAALFFFAGGLLTSALLSRRAPGAWLAPPALDPRFRRAGRDRRATVERAWSWTVDAGWLALAGAVAAALVEAADAAGGLSARGLSDFLLSNDAGLARVATVAALVMAVVQATRLPIAASSWLALALLAIAFGGHANSAEQRGLAVLTDWIHLIAGAVWIGGIAQIVVAWLPLVGRGRELGLEAGRAVLPRFGRLALPAFLVVAVSGLTNALIQLGHPEALWETSYGQVLAAKVGLVALIALASYGHAFRLRPRLLASNPHPPARTERRHWRLLGAEPWLGLAVIVAVAALVTFPLPPRQLDEADEAEAAAPCDPCPLATARENELAVAEAVGTRVAALWVRRDSHHLHGRLELLDDQGKPVEASISIAGAELRDCGDGCWRFEAPLADELTLTAAEDGEEFTATLPTTWERRRTAGARRLLGRAQEAMRALGSLRLNESVRSGPDNPARIRYRFRAPDRMAYRTDRNSRVVAIAKVGYRRSPGQPWSKYPFGVDGFRLERFFRWTAYGESVRWLGTRAAGGQRVVELALFDPATPLWYRVAIDRRGRVVEERLIVAGHFMDRRFFAFDEPVRISAPR